MVRIGRGEVHRGTEGGGSGLALSRFRVQNSVKIAQGFAGGDLTRRRDQMRDSAAIAFDRARPTTSPAD